MQEFWAQSEEDLLTVVARNSLEIKFTEGVSAGLAADYALITGMPGRAVAFGRPATKHTILSVCTTAVSLSTSQWILEKVQAFRLHQTYCKVLFAEFNITLHCRAQRALFSLNCNVVKWGKAKVPKVESVNFATSAFCRQFAAWRVLLFALQRFC